MSKLQKSQHYVWREYLRAWAPNEYIWTYFNKSRKTLQPNITGVAQENYFYELIEISSQEEIQLKEFIESMVDPSIMDLCSDFISAFTMPSKLKRIFKPHLTDEFTASHGIFREMEVNTMEKAHGIFEKAGAKFIKCRSIQELQSFMEVEDNYFNTMLFICFQYFRTKKIKENILRDIDSKKFPLIKFWNIISFCMAIQLTKSLSLDPRVIFIVFKSYKIPFLTCDQPAFNLKEEELNEKGKVKNFELYYPLSPDTAIVMQIANQPTEKFKEVQINPSMANYFNKIVIEKSRDFVFSSNQEQLNELLNSAKN